MSLTCTAAFFDVDETLTTGKSMFDFLRFHIDDDQTPDVGQAGRLAEMQQLADAGSASRAEINRSYYRIYRGLPARLLRDQGLRWFDQQRRTPGFIRPAVFRALLRHRQAEHAVVLVSGSFPACLEPLQAATGARHLLSSRPLVGADGLLTGEVEQPMIGPAKAAGIRALARQHGYSLPPSFGYGDHASDLPMLLAVGHPAVVGSDPVLDRYVARRHWLHIPTAEAPPAATHRAM